MSLIIDFSKLDNCFEIDRNSIVKLEWISEIFPVFSSPKFFKIDVIVDKWSLIDLSSSSFSTNLFNTIVSSLIFSEILTLIKYRLSFSVVLSSVASYLLAFELSLIHI